MLFHVVYVNVWGAYVTRSVKSAYNHRNHAKDNGYGFTHEIRRANSAQVHEYNMTGVMRGRVVLSASHPGASPRW